MALFQRLVPQVPENIRASTILNQLTPEIRSILRSPHDYQNTEDLVNVATKVENDIREMKNSKYIPPMFREHSTNVKDLSSVRTVTEKKSKLPPFPCQYCNAMHFHKDCPKNPYKSKNEDLRVVGANKTNQTEWRPTAQK